MTDEEPEPLTKEELTELLAEATGMTVEEFEEESEDFEIAPPWEAEVVDDEEDE